MPQEVSRRQIRLEKEQKHLEALNRDSDHVKVVPVDPLSGRVPERYRVTFSCRGITGIEESQSPIYGLKHEVVLYCHEDFPADVPWLRWETAIWHPNIEHREPKNVCVNKKEWLGGMTLVDLCQQLFEMAQYKNYHAEHTWPYPLDSEAAAWVRQYAEPNGLIDKKRGIFVDNRPFFKPTAAERSSQIHILGPSPDSQSGSRIKIQSRMTKPSGSETRVVLQAGGEPVCCAACGAELPADSRFCDKCGNPVGEKVKHVRFGN